MFHVKHYDEQTWELFHVKHMDINKRKNGLTNQKVYQSISPT